MHNIDMAPVEDLARILLAAIRRLGELGRPGAIALARLVEDGDADFDEAVAWIADIAAGDLGD